MNAKDGDAPPMDADEVAGLLSVPKGRLPKYLAIFGLTVFAGLVLSVVVSVASGTSFVEEVFSVGSRVGSVAAGCAAILISVEGVVMGGYSLLVKRAERRGEQRGERRGEQRGERRGEQRGERRGEQRGERRGRNEERRRMERWREEQVEAGFDLPPLPDPYDDDPAPLPERDT